MPRSWTAELDDAVAALRVQREAAADATWEFSCECDRPDCSERVVLSLAQYQALKKRPDLVLAAGHEESRMQRDGRLAEAFMWRALKRIASASGRDADAAEPDGR